MELERNDIRLTIGDSKTEKLIAYADTDKEQLWELLKYHEITTGLLKRKLGLATSETTTPESLLKQLDAANQTVNLLKEELAYMSTINENEKSEGSVKCRKQDSKLYESHDNVLNRKEISVTEMDGNGTGEPIISL